MSSSWKTLRLKLICAKCNNTFKNPKLLPCLDGCKKDIQCPSCKATIPVPLNVKELASDVYTARLVEILNNKSNLKCQNCFEDALVFAICSKCKVILCEACTEAHKRAVRTQKHELLLVSEMRSSTGPMPTVLFEEDEKCPIQPTKLLTFYCRREGELLCEVCAKERHANHDYVEIDDTLLEEERRILKDILPGIQQFISALEETVKAVGSRRTQGKAKKEENLCRIPASARRTKSTQNPITRIHLQ